MIEIEENQYYILKNILETLVHRPKSCLCDVEQPNPKNNILKDSCMICNAKLLLESLIEQEKLKVDDKIINKVVALQKVIMTSKWDTYQEKFELDQIFKKLTKEQYIYLKEKVQNILGLYNQVIIY